jgi:peptidoglycan/LPS O-acetylase OafA/YrhL
MGQGLTLFFALSGFLLYLPWVRRLSDQRPAPSSRTFYFNRIVRIYPAYIVVLLIGSYVLQSTYVTTPPAGAVGMDGSRGVMTDPLQIVANLFLVQTLIPRTMTTGLGVSWSLTTELCFYAILPLLGLAAYAVARRFRSAPIGAFVPPVAMIALGVACTAIAQATVTGPPERRYALDWGDTWHAVFARSLLGQAQLFGFGMLAAALVAVLSTPTRRSRVRVVRVALWVFCLSFPVTVLAASPDVAFALSGAALIGLVALPTSSARVSRLARVLEWTPFRVLGLVSYSYYLWHAVVINFVRERSLAFDPRSAAGFGANWLLVFLCTLALASATYFTVERPFMRLRDRMRSRR